MTKRDELPRTSITAKERRFWRVQRISWWVMGALLVAALLGAFGGGPLSGGRRIVAGGSGELRYERILRLGQEGSMAWSGLTAVADSVVIELDADDRALSIRTESQPEADRVTMTRRGMRLVYRADRDSIAPIVMSISPKRPGFLTLRARIAAGPWMDIPFFVLPED